MRVRKVILLAGVYTENKFSVDCEIYIYNYAIKINNYIIIILYTQNYAI
jgi:hypothetical protein